MGKQEGEQLHVKAIHSLASTLYLVSCSGTWKRATPDVLCHIPYLLADFWLLERLRTAPVECSLNIQASSFDTIGTNFTLTCFFSNF